jgi:general secretion pathway protein D
MNRRVICPSIGLAAALLAGVVPPARSQEPSLAAADTVRLHFLDAELRTVVQALARHLPKPVMMGAVPPTRVTLETPGPVPRHEVVTLLRGLLESQSLRLVEDSAFFTVTSAPPVAMMAPAGPGAPAGGPVSLHVIRLRHARAADVAATINLLFGGGGDFSGRPGLSAGTLTEELRRTNVPAGGVGALPVPSPSRGANLAGATVVVPDELTNALLIRASDQDFEVLRSAVEQLDVRPLQVLIEVLILEARKDRAFSIGADLTVPPQALTGDASIDARTVGGGLGDLVVRLMRLGKADVDAVIRMAQSRGDVRIVSRPVLLASNNVEARFLVGSQRPFVQVSRTQPTDGATRDQVVQYKDVGTKLTVRPTINHDGYVSLIVQQEISTATDETQFDAPIISTREAVTQVLVRDGQTIVIGGLRDRQTSDLRSGVPILSGIPLIGGLFGGQSRSRSEVELFLFLTPRILRDDGDVERLNRALHLDPERMQ